MHMAEHACRAPQCPCLVFEWQPREISLAVGEGRGEGDENKVTSLHSKLLNKMLSFIAVPFISTLVFNFSTRTHQRGRMGGR